MNRRDFLKGTLATAVATVTYGSVAQPLPKSESSSYIIGGDKPNAVAGDIWWNSADEQLVMYTGSERGWMTIGQAT